MIEKETEQRFIQHFIRPERRERLLYELSGKKRREGIGRFCHDAKSLLSKENIIASGPLSLMQLQALIKRYAAGEACYLCAYNEALDGKRLPSTQALTLALGNGMAAILIFDCLALVETEQEAGIPERFALFKGSSNIAE